MRFNILLALIVSSSALVACTGGSGKDKDYLIGEKVERISPMLLSEGPELEKVAIFDKTVGKIHQFNFANQSVERSLQVSDPSVSHFVMLDPARNYIVDMSEKSFAIFNSAGVQQLNPIKFQGKPLSAVFLPSKGSFAMLDSLRTVGLMKLSQTGDVESRWLGGSLIQNDATVASGDIRVDGKLVFALSDDSIAIIDFDQSIAQAKWVVNSTFASGVSDIRWLATFPGDQSLALAMGASRLALLNLTTGTKVAEYTFATGEKVAKVSRQSVPHMVLRQGNNLRLFYVEGSQIKSRMLYRELETVLFSKLDITKDSWTLVHGVTEYNYDTNYLDSRAVSRKLEKFRFSDLLSMRNMTLADSAELEITTNRAFALYPSELGFAEAYGIDDESLTQFKLFNVR